MRAGHSYITIGYTLRGSQHDTLMLRFEPPAPGPRARGGERNRTPLPLLATPVAAVAAVALAAVEPPMLPARRVAADRPAALRAGLLLLPSPDERRIIGRLRKRLRRRTGAVVVVVVATGGAPCARAGTADSCSGRGEKALARSRWAEPGDERPPKRMAELARPAPEVSGEAAAAFAALGEAKDEARSGVGGRADAARDGLTPRGARGAEAGIV